MFGSYIKYAQSSERVLAEYDRVFRSRGRKYADFQSVMARRQRMSKRRRVSGRFTASKRRRISRPQVGFLRTGGYYRPNGFKQELKFYDNQTSGTFTAAGTTVFTPLQNLKAGTGESDRVGRKIVLRSLQVKSSFRLGAIDDQTGLDAHQKLRYAIVIDKQSNGSAPDIEDIYQTNGISLTQQFPNLENKGRFRILFQRVYTMNFAAAAGGFNSVAAATELSAAPKEFKVEKFIKLNIPVYFSGVLGLNTEFKSNNIFVFVTREHNENVPHSEVYRVRFDG